VTKTHRERVWFITGAGRGFGLLFTQTALSFGITVPKPPRRVLLGGEYDMIMDLYRQRLDEWQAGV
jgi:hypothetical protein